jgi:hypothetical protein
MQRIESDERPWTCTRGCPLLVPKPKQNLPNIRRSAVTGGLASCIIIADAEDINRNACAWVIAEFLKNRGVEVHEAQPYDLLF